METHFSKKYVQDVVERYCAKNPGEDIRLRIEELLASKESCTSRKNFFGHITASAFVLDSALSKILLVHHKIFDRLLQPGGHVEGTDATFLQAAMRELAEETGFTHILPVLIDTIRPDTPFDIDIHTIPENQKNRNRNTCILIFATYSYCKTVNGER